MSSIQFLLVVTAEKIVTDICVTNISNICRYTRFSIGSVFLQNPASRPIGYSNKQKVRFQ